MKCLGHNVDCTLSWSFHVSDLYKRFSCTCFALRTMAPLLGPKPMMTVYYGLISSVMSYSVELWEGSSDAHRVLSVQRRAVLKMKYLLLSDSCVGAFRKHGILRPPSLFISKVILVTFSINADLKTSQL